MRIQIRRSFLKDYLPKRRFKCFVSECCTTRLTYSITCDIYIIDASAGNEHYVFVAMKIRDDVPFGFKNKGQKIQRLNQK